MRTVTLALLALVTAPAMTMAQEAYVVEDDDYIDAPEPAVQPLGPRVYGWTAAPPSDCGTFKYWNGEYCADARFEPPRSADD